MDSLTIKDQLQQAIKEENDPKFRSILSLLQLSIEHIGTRLDEVLSNETRLREAVLNGTAANHDSDHEWVEGWRRRDTEVRDAFAWVAEKRRLEEANSGSYRKIIENLVSQIALPLLAIIAGFLIGKF